MLTKHNLLPVCQLCRKPIPNEEVLKVIWRDADGPIAFLHPRCVGLGKYVAYRLLQDAEDSQ